MKLWGTRPHRDYKNRSEDAPFPPDIMWGQLVWMLLVLSRIPETRAQGKGGQSHVGLGKGRGDLFSLYWGGSRTPI